jgi:hypothetical protein
VNSVQISVEKCITSTSASEKVGFGVPSDICMFVSVYKYNTRSENFVYIYCCGYILCRHFVCMFI